MTVSRDHYYKLASDLESERIEGATALIKQLTNEDTESEWKYALDRLIKGLSSSRASARIGFSMCLSEVLSILISEKQQINVKQYSIMLNEKLKQSVPKTNGKAERSILFGQLFGLQSLLNSGVIVSDIQNGEIDNYLYVLSQLIELALTKSWIRETVFGTIYKSLLQLGIGQTKYASPVYAFVLSKIHEVGLTLTTEGLLVYLSIPAGKRHEMVLATSIPDTGDNVWKLGDPLLKANVSTLSKVLKDVDTAKEVNADNVENNKQKGSWSPTLHTCWTPMLHEIISQDSVHVSKLEKRKEKKQKHASVKASEKLLLSEFWKVCVDEQFFSMTASPERKYWGFEALTLILSFPNLPSDKIPSLVTPNLMRTLINQSSNNDRVLNTLARSVLKKLVGTCEQNQDRIIPVLKALITKPVGSINFDKFTKSKTVQEIVQIAQGEHLSDVIELLTSLETHTDAFENDEDIIKTQIFVLDTLVHLVKNKKTSSTSVGTSSLEWLNLIMEYLSIHAFMKGSNEAAFTDRMAQSSIERMYSVLSDIMSTPSMSDPHESWPYKTLMGVENRDKTNLKYRNDFDGSLDDIMSLGLKSAKSINKLRRSSKKSISDKILNCFEILFSITLLQMHSGDSDSADVLNDLHSAYEEAMSSKGNTEKIEKELVDTLIDLMLSYISQKSSLMKKISTTIWENLVDVVDAEQLDRVFDILLTKENKEGQEKLFKGDAEDVEEEEEDKEGEEDEEESEESEEESEEEESEEEEEEEEDGEGDEENDDDEADTDGEKEVSRKKKVSEVDKTTSLALATALGIPTEVSGEVKFDSSDDDSDMDSDSDVESMSDEQMLSLDVHLAAIFKNRRDAMNSLENKSGQARKVEVQNAREMMAFFKGRLVDLLEIFNTKRPESELNIYIADCLLRLMELTMDKNLGAKAHKLLKTKICKSKLVIAQADDSEDVFENYLNTLADIQLSSHKSPFNAYSLACSQVSIFISKSLVNNCGSDELKTEIIGKIIDIYSVTLKTWAVDGNSRAQSSLFFDLVNWLNSKRPSTAGAPSS